jgi:hypothetical protein
MGCNDGLFFFASSGIKLPISNEILTLHGVVFDILVGDPAAGAAPVPAAGERPRERASIQPARCPFAAAKIPLGNSALTMISVWLGA